MRNLSLLAVYQDNAAAMAFYGAPCGASGGVYTVPSPIDRAPMRVIASSGEGWDHVSVSRTNRCPNWPEMEAVKRLFFRDDETAMQLHVPPSQHISFHPHCLHIWRPNDGREIPMPPAEFVGPVALQGAA